MENIKEYSYPVTELDHKIICDKHIFYYLKTGGFSWIAFTRMILIIITLFFDIFFFLSGISLGGIIIIILICLNVMIAYSGKFIYVNKNIFKKRKDRNEPIDLDGAEYFKCRCDLKEHGYNKENNSYYITVLPEKENITLNITEEVYRKVKKYYQGFDIILFMYETVANRDKLEVYDVLQFKVYESFLKKKRRFKKKDYDLEQFKELERQAKLNKQGKLHEIDELDELEEKDNLY